MHLSDSFRYRPTQRFGCDTLRFACAIIAVDRSQQESFALLRYAQWLLREPCRDCSSVGSETGILDSVAAQQYLKNVSAAAQQQ